MVVRSVSLGSTDEERVRLGDRWPVRFDESGTLFCFIMLSRSLTNDHYVLLPTPGLLHFCAITSFQCCCFFPPGGNCYPASLSGIQRVVKNNSPRSQLRPSQPARLYLPQEMQKCALMTMEKAERHDGRCNVIEDTQPSWRTSNHYSIFQTELIVILYALRHAHRRLEMTVVIYTHSWAALQVLQQRATSQRQRATRHFHTRQPAELC
ncbi:hypothetical protein E2C01_042757 [Portunus trituberculatus]|uniref:RNase H type-1 domain-containing protein n=1 Tax=Portunus trituberculatus TaxID=210409 RepID=A0A5B7FML9_PORTR|nr:hypothetical protein [Portunus trituberculatus]